MPRIFSIDTSLVVRFGNTTYQFNRYLDERRKVQFENQLTGEFKVFELSRFYTMFENGELKLILGNEIADPTNEGSLKQHRILDLKSLPEHIRKEVEFRMTVVRFIRKMNIRRGQRTKIAKALTQCWEVLAKKSEKIVHKPVSDSTVMDWLRKYETSGKNPAALVSQNLHRKRSPSTNPEVEAAMEWSLKTYYLKPERLPLTYAYERLTGKLDDLVSRKKLSAEEARVSLATFQRRKDAIDPFAVKAARYGKHVAHHAFRATYEGTQVRRAMARLEVDHTVLNWIVICDRTGLPLGRPTLTVIVDSYSGYIVGLYVSFNGPGLTSVVNVIKNSIRPKQDLAEAAGTIKPWVAWGIGDCYLLDNGMEFHARAFQLMAWELAADLEYCRVRFPWVKPHVERFFRDLDYLTLTSGRVHKPVPNMVALDPNKEATITLSGLCRGLIMFACDQHAFTPNSKTLELPFERYAESVEKNPPPQMPDSLRSLDFIAAMSKELMVTNGGVAFNGLSYAGQELRELLISAGGKFRTLVKWNPDDLGYLYVQHSRTKEWVTLKCTRADYANGLSWNQHRLVRDFTRSKLHMNGTVEHLLLAKERLHEIWMEPLARKNRSLEFESAKRMGRLCATAPTFQTENPPSVQSPAKVLAEEEMVYQEKDVPDFDSILM